MPLSTDLRTSRFAAEAGEIALKPEGRLYRQRTEGQQARLTLLRALDPIIFVSLLVLLPLTAIPYGTVEPWWVAIFECLVFLVAVAAVVETYFADDFQTADLKLVAPLLALTAFVFVQSLMVLPGNGGAISALAISADPYGTRLLAVKILALVLFGLLLLRYTSSKSRFRALIYVVIGIGVASAVFGLLRKSFQHDAGFLLPGLPNNGRGFAQFINRNHFAYLIEMTLGLTIGLILSESRRSRKLLWLLPAALLLWITIVVSNSRGGILASLCQLLFFGLLLDPVWHLFKRVNEDRTRLQNLLGGVALRVLLIGCFIVVFVFGVIWIGGESVVTNFELAAPTFGQQGLDNRENTSRKQIWSSTWQAFKTNPIVGIGAGGYWIAIRKYHDATGEYTPQEAHNDYLELLASGGIVGTALVLWFLFVFLSRARQSLKSPDWFYRAASLGALAGIFGVAIHSFVDFGLHITSNALVTCALMVIAVHRPEETGSNA